MIFLELQPMLIDTNELWTRITKNQGQVIETKTGKKLKYEIDGEIIQWVPLEVTLNNPWNQSKARS